MDKLLFTEEKVFSYIKKYNMISENDNVIIGVSGGADSVCLLFVLSKYREIVPFNIYVCHINHQIRSEAGLDADYVREICRSLGVPFYLKEVDVCALAKNMKMSEEEAGRYARYEAFNEVAHSLNTEEHTIKIAVAHNMNDRSETLLFNLFRGCSQRGLGSIRPVRDNIIRPILCLERIEIEKYLNDLNIHFCQDRTNFENEYSRNKIRNVILPYVEKEIIDGAITNIARAAKEAAGVEEYLFRQTTQALKRCVDENVVSLSMLKKEDELIQGRIVYELIIKAAKKAKDISNVHVEEVLNIIESEGCHTIDLPYGLVAVKEYDKLYFVDKNHYLTEDSINEIQIQMAEGTRIIELPQGRLEISVFEYSDQTVEIPSNKYTKWFDYDKINKPLVVRNRRKGDYLSIASSNGNIIHKSVKDYMVNSKIPKHKRDSMLLIALDNHILWLLGERISEYYKVTDETKKILQMNFFSI